MHRTPDINIFREDRSEEVQEIINRPPPWIVSRGISLFFILLIILGVSCWIIKYPDIISTAFILTSVESPRTILAKTDGKLQKLLVKDGQIVKTGQILAFGESTANHKQVLELNDDITNSSIFVGKANWSDIENLKFTKYDQLGEIQNDFQIFTQKLAELKTFLNGGFYQKKRKLLFDDLVDLKDMEKNISEQLELQRRDFSLAQEEFAMQERLFKDKVISLIEYKKENAKMLSREMPIKNLLSNLIQNRSSQTAKRKEVLELDNLIAEHKTGFKQSLQTLQSSIEFWKQKYLFKAPVSGKVSFAAPWQEQQNIVAGQELLTVEPFGSEFQGIIKISQTNFGKIKEGQVVLIKLDGYSYKEYGILEGKLAKFSSTLGRDSLYWGYVSLPHQLTTKYGRNLSYRNGLRGNAEIVTADRRLAERLISVIDNGK